MGMDCVTSWGLKSWKLLLFTQEVLLPQQKRIKIDTIPHAITKNIKICKNISPTVGAAFVGTIFWSIPLLSFAFFCVFRLDLFIINSIQCLLIKNPS